MSSDRRSGEYSPLLGFAIGSVAQFGLDWLTPGKTMLNALVLVMSTALIGIFIHRRSTVGIFSAYGLYLIGIFDTLLWQIGLVQEEGILKLSTLFLLLGTLPTLISVGYIWHGRPRDDEKEERVKSGQLHSLYLLGLAMVGGVIARTINLGLIPTTLVYVATVLLGAFCIRNFRQDISVALIAGLSVCFFSVWLLLFPATSPWSQEQLNLIQPLAFVISVWVVGAAFLARSLDRETLALNLDDSEPEHEISLGEAAEALTKHFTNTVIIFFYLGRVLSLIDRFGQTVLGTAIGLSLIPFHPFTDNPNGWVSGLVGFVLAVLITAELDDWRKGIYGVCNFFFGVVASYILVWFFSFKLGFDQRGVEVGILILGLLWIVHIVTRKTRTEAFIAF